MASNGGKKPRLLDLFCGAGGAAMGYHRAGFEVVGVDIKDQPNYPFEMWVDNAVAFMELVVSDDPAFHIDDFDAIHASPPCQASVKGMRAVNKALGRPDVYVDLIADVRELLNATGLPWVIENVVGAALIDPVLICGSMFDPVMEVRRHRLFETNWPLNSPIWPCRHKLQQGDYWTSWRPNGEKRRAKVMQVYGQAAERGAWIRGMGMDRDWTDLSSAELSEAIPPAYTEFIGHQLVTYLTHWPNVGLNKVQSGV